MPWHASFRTVTLASLSRHPVRLRSLIVSAAVVIGAIGTIGTPVAAQTVVDFEDLSGAGPLPASYGGIAWLGGGWRHYDWAQEPFNASSGVVRVYRHDSVSQFGFVDGPVTFGGAWFAGVSDVQFYLYFDGSLVHSTGTMSLSSTPAFLSSGFQGAVDLVEARMGESSQWVMDDVMFSAATTVTPEPASFALVGLGLVALGGGAWRRRRRSIAD